jgi:hypothetical protein
MRLTIPKGGVADLDRLTGLLLAGALLLGNGAPAALAATPLPPPNFESVTAQKNGDIELTWKMVENTVPVGNGGKRGAGSDAPWGYRLNVYIDQTGELIGTKTIKPVPASEFSTGESNRDWAQDDLFFNRGTIDVNRYCITMQSYVTHDPNLVDFDKAQFSAETRRRCIGTQKDVIVTESQGPSPFGPSTPPPPTKPDLSVTRVTGPLTVANGDTPVYEFVLWNDGTPAQGTAQIQIGAIGSLTLDSLVQLPNGFTCDTNDFGVACVGSLGGVNDPVQVRGATFKMQMRANGTGKATVFGDANHDRALDEMTVDNNMKSVDVAVQ